MSITADLKELFSYDGKLDRILIVITILINLLVLTNSVLHDPYIGYDVDGHLDYIRTLPLRLPGPQDSAEYFSPPLPYFIPSLFYQACQLAQPGFDCTIGVGKFAQLLNVFLSIGISLIILKIYRLRSANRFFRISTLVMLGILPVYYKTFAQVRGEPYLAFFTALTLYLTLKLIIRQESLTWKDGIGLGLVLGLLILSRQWGFFLFPAYGLLMFLGFLKNMHVGWRISQTVLVSFAAAALVGGWFYIHLYTQQGTAMAFNRKYNGFSFSNQPLSFYRNIGIRNYLLFTDPVRPTFNNQLIPTFYSDTWGDYWGYFTFIREKSPLGYTNRDQIAPYLGRVNLVSLFPSLIFLAGMVIGITNLIKSLNRRGSSAASLFYSFITVGILCSLLGFLWFLIAYPIIPKGANIKATYMMQVFIMLPLLAAEFMDKARTFRPWVYSIIMGVVGLVFLFDLPTMITRYSWPKW